MFKLLMNAGLVFRIISHVRGIIEKCVRGPDHMPAKADILILLDDVEALCDSGLIKIPGVEMTDVSGALQKIEDEIKGGG